MTKVMPAPATSMEINAIKSKQKNHLQNTFWLCLVLPDDRCACTTVQYACARLTVRVTISNGTFSTAMRKVSLLVKYCLLPTAYEFSIYFMQSKIFPSCFNTNNYFCRRKLFLSPEHESFVDLLRTYICSRSEQRKFSNWKFKCRVSLLALEIMRTTKNQQNVK